MEIGQPVRQRGFLQFRQRFASSITWIPKEYTPLLSLTLILLCKNCFVNERYIFDKKSFSSSTSKLNKSPALFYSNQKNLLKAILQIYITKTSKLLKAVCGVCAAGMMLTVCGSNAASTSSGSTSTESTGNAKSTRKTLTYWSMWNSTEGQAKVIQEATDAYEEATGIKINIEWKGQPDCSRFGRR